MKPADRYAALRALQYGIGAAVDRAAEIVEQVRENTGAKAFTTPYGQVTFTKRAPAISINSARFLAHCEEHAPGEIVTERTVRSSYTKAIEARLSIVGNQVVDQDGVVVDYATVRPGTECIGAKLTADAKTAVADQMLGRIDELAAFPQLDGAPTDPVVELSHRRDRTHPYDQTTEEHVS